jgi:hypothetical protein
MPAARTDIDEAGICLRVAMQGIRPTATATGLPVATVRDIAKRNNVKVPDASTRLVPASTQQRQPYRDIHTPSTQPAHAIATDAVSANGARGRLAASRIGADALETIAHTMTAEPASGLALLDSALTAGKLLQTGNVPGWERQNQAIQAGIVNIALLGVEPASLQRTVQDQGDVESP